jgi:hypothetical protein
MKGFLLVIMFCFSVSTANAECAWVLWKLKTVYIYNTKRHDKPLHTEWSRVVVVPDYKECRMNQLSAFRAEVALARTNQPDSIDSLEGLEGGPSRISVRFKTGYEEIEFQCLPDTIDPRK